MNYQKFLNASQAADYLGVSRKHFYAIRKKYEIKVMGREAHMNLYALKQLSDVKRKLKKLRALYAKTPIA